LTRIALDSNILVYFAGIERAEDDRPKIDRTRALIATLGEIATLVAPVQALGELFVVMRRSGAPVAEARTLIAVLRDACETPASDGQAAEAAMQLVEDHKLQYWDALIVGVAADARCTLLLSEDMQHGFATRGLTIVNPFADPIHPKLAALVAS
jgi:predicted nucleic acid-binding protein